MTERMILPESTRLPSEIFAEPAWLAEHLDDRAVRVVEMDVSRSAYEQGHIPGAILWNIYVDLRHGDYSLLERSELAELLGRSGLTPDDIVVFYGYGSYLGFWLMRAYGLTHALILRGTRQDWHDQGRPWTTDVPRPAATEYTLPTAEPLQLISQSELEGSLGEGDSLILDVRSDAEFSGERFWPSGASTGAGRPGHIPGAVHLHVDQLRQSHGSLKAEEDLQQLFRSHGAVPGRGIVTYCTIGNRASEVAFVLTYLLRYPDVRVYYGSWAEWGSQPETPIEVSRQM